MDFAVTCFVDETCSTHVSNVDLCILNVLNVEALDAERKYNLRVSHVLNDYILFTLVITGSLDNILIIIDVFDL